MKIILSILIILKFTLNSLGQCYEQNLGKKLDLFSPFLNNNPRTIEAKQGMKFGDSINWSYCHRLKKRSIGVFYDLRPNSPIFAANSGYVTVYSSVSASENEQTKDAAWINSDSLTTNYVGLLIKVISGQYIYKGQIIGFTYNEKAVDYNLGFNIRRHRYLNPYAKRMFLPVVEDSAKNCLCKSEPLFPEYFVNPTSKFIAYDNFNEQMPIAKIAVNINNGNLGKWSFDNGITWHESGMVIDNLPLGYYKIIFKDEYGYFVPKSEEFILTSNNNEINLAANYNPNYIILKRPQADMEREADKNSFKDLLKININGIKDSLSIVKDSVYKKMAINKNESFRNYITDSINKKLENIETIQNEQVIISKIFKYLLPILALAIAFIIILLLQNGKIKKQKNNLEVMQKELHHRVHNNLSIISSLINNYGKSIPKEKIQELDNSIKAMATVHQLLQKGNDLTKINLQTLCATIIEALLKQAGKNANLNIDASILLPQKITSKLALIINELVTNTIKYGLKGSLSDKIIITAATDEKNKNIIITYKDSGSGYNENFNDDNYGGFGKVLIIGLTEEINGQIKFYNDNGATCEIKLKLLKDA